MTCALLGEYHFNYTVNPLVISVDKGSTARLINAQMNQLIIEQLALKNPLVGGGVG